VKSNVELTNNTVFCSSLNTYKSCGLLQVSFLLINNYSKTHILDIYWMSWSYKSLCNYCGEKLSFSCISYWSHSNEDLWLQRCVPVDCWRLNAWWTWAVGCAAESWADGSPANSTRQETGPMKVVNKKMTSICELWYQRLDWEARISLRLQKVSETSRVTWSPVLPPEPITSLLFHSMLTLLVQVGRSYLSTYLLIPWSRVLLEKLTDFQLVKKFTAFYGTRRFITAFTSPYPEPAQSSPYPHIPLP
jgi:hypothetical protein